MDPKPGVTKMNKDVLSPQWALSYATTETPIKVVPLQSTDRDTSAQAAERKIMELRIVLEHRRKTPLTPYKADSWELLLHQCNLQHKYPRLVSSIWKGFDTGIWKIYQTFTPPNSPSLDLHPENYQEILSKELHTGQYVGPLL
jgi:hypothetical protein